MAVPFPEGFPRIPDEPWTRAPVDEFARRYDALGGHSWYANLEPTVAAAAPLARDGGVLVDYSCGTGLFLERLLRAAGDEAFGAVNVDSSAKFLRLALEKRRDDPRAAFRLLRMDHGQQRLQYLHEVLGPLVGKVAAIVSTNAMHLYYDLDATVASWARCLRPGGLVLAQSGNVPVEAGAEGSWTLDATVEAVARAAESVVREDAAYARWRATLADPSRRSAYLALRRKYFLPPRPLSAYRLAMEGAGLRVESVERRPVTVRVDEWAQFLDVYHEGILGWVGGSEKVDGKPASDEDVRARRTLLRRAVERVFSDRPTFEATWTYVTARSPLG
ncbi:MAG TPA: class I SAM-dependent methyltransferase [Candidatus Thermoplasmatota archaeon]|nr:class I SAM-dependent methyltransferase [Candidatus Thermoplasmatota archaeon]